MRRLVWLLLLCLPVLADTPEAPPGPNVHLVRETETGHLWRGGGPRVKTLEALQQSASERNVKVTLFDLRHPSNADDRSGKDGRLSPQDEQKWAAEHGLTYRSHSSFEDDLPALIDKALAEGDVYVHCMYGVNRTGFTVGRYCTRYGLKIDRSGMGERDWNQGVAWQKRVGP